MRNDPGEDEVERGASALVENRVQEPRDRGDVNLAAVLQPERRLDAEKTPAPC